MQKKTTQFLLIFSFFFLFLGLLWQSPLSLINNLNKIITSSGVLIADSFIVGGIGASLVNASLLMLGAVFLALIVQADWSGSLIAAIFLMFGFGFFGKNILNVIPILLGAYLYTRLYRIPYRNVLVNALFATSFAPIFTEFVFVMDIPRLLGLFLGLTMSMATGFLIVPLASHLRESHRGFNLYNTGFSVGLLSTLFVSLMRSYGYVPYKQALIEHRFTTSIGIVLALTFLLLILWGLFYERKPLTKLKKLLQETGYKNNDFYQNYGLGIMLINMGINGFASLAYVLLIGADLNGPSIGAIFGVVAFAGYGKHLLNIFPIFLGVILGGLTKTWAINDPVIVFAALFGTSLAPIAGVYGIIPGILVGFINSSVVLVTGSLHGGMNLYNTGFSAGIVATVMVPLLSHFLTSKDK